MFQDEELLEASGRGCLRVLSGAGLALSIGVTLTMIPWLAPAGMVFSGVALAWVHLIHKDCRSGKFFPSKAWNVAGSWLFRSELHILISMLLMATQVWSSGALLNFFVLPFLVMHATLSSPKEKKGPSEKLPMHSLFFPTLESESPVFRRKVNGDDEDWQLGVALHRLPMYQLQHLSRKLSQEPGTRGTFASPSSRDAKECGESDKTPLDMVSQMIRWPAQSLLRDMWLWTERDLVLNTAILVSIFLMETLAGAIHPTWAPAAILLCFLLSNAAGVRRAPFQEKIAEPHSWLRMNIPALVQAWVFHVASLFIVLPGLRTYVPWKEANVPFWQTYLWALALLVCSVAGAIGTNLAWATSSVRGKVFLMMINQGSIFQRSQDQRSHGKHKGTAAARGVLDSYISWFLDTPEAADTADASDLLQDQVVTFQNKVDCWFKLFICHAVPVCVPLLWGEEVLVSWMIAGCFRSALALHVSLMLLHFQHLWAPTKTIEAQREVLPSGPRLPDKALQTAADGGVFVKYKVGETGMGDSALEVRMEPLWRRSTMVDLVKDVVAEILEVTVSKVKPERPLMDLGFDSAGALLLRNQLARRLKVDLPPTFLFDYPTINDMVDNGLALVSKRPMTPAHHGVGQVAEAAQHVMVSTSCHLPASADSLNQYWTLLAEKRDAVVEVPLARWDHELYYSTEPQKGQTYARHAGFVEGTDLFDASYFNLGTVEAKTTDPQQRLLLTAAYDALRGDGYDKGFLQSNPLGVFTALSNNEWFHMVVPEAGVYTGPGVSSAIAANRISYTFGLKGPSMTIDTACSSSLSALHAAVRSLEAKARRNVASTSRGALLNAAEVLHGPTSFVLRSVAGMLSRDGRCKTFDATANGYIRGEGAGAALLKTKLGAEEGRSLRLAEVRAVVMNQDGKSATLTAPNGPSQEELLLMAIEEAQLEPNALECHGTGTALGDPIEVGAIQAALGRPEGASRLYLAAGKSNHGHLEGAAGFAGLMKVVCCLQRREVPPNLHFQELNPHISLTSSHLEVPSSTSSLNAEVSVMGVSSFGFGGTNTHALISSCADGFEEPPERVAFLFTGQGSQLAEMGRKLYRCDERFKAAVDQCAELLEGHPLLEPTGDLRDILFAEGPEAALRYDQSTSLSQLAIFAVEFALAETWRARGLQPFALLGHSVGEFAAAVVAGVMSLEDGLRLVARRGELIDQNCDIGVGAMASIFASEEQVQKVLDELGELGDQKVVIAAINGPAQTVVSGHKAAVKMVCDKVDAQSKVLSIPHAMHSPLMAPILPELLAASQKCQLRPPRGELHFVSCLLGREASKELCDPSYWVGHDEPKPMLFVQGMSELQRLGCDAFLEIGPQPVLVKMGRRCVGKEASAEKLWLASMQPGCDEVESMLVASRALGVAFTQPSELAPASLPWRKPMLHPLLGREVAKHFFEASETVTDLEGQQMQLFKQHQVFDRVVLPGASHLLLAAAAHLTQQAAAALELTDVIFELPFVVEAPLKVQCYASPERTEVLSQTEESVVHARMGVTQPVAAEVEEGRLQRWRELCADAEAVESLEDLYKSFQERGLRYGEAFRTLGETYFGQDAAMTRLKRHARSWEKSLQLLHPALLDGALQLLVECASRNAGATFLPSAVRRAVVAAQCPAGELWAGVRVEERSEKFLVADVEVFNEQGVLAVKLEGASCRKAEAMQERDVADDVLYDIEWDVLADSEEPVESHTAIVVGLEGAKLMDQLGMPARLESLEEALESISTMKGGLVVFEASGEQLEALHAALRLLQAVASAPQAPELLLCTRGAQGVASTLATHDPEHAGLWGLARSARLEQPDLQVSCLDLERVPSSTALGPWFSVENDLAQRGELMLAARLARSSVSARRPERLQMTCRGSLTNLKTIPQSKRSAPPDQLELRVEAIGLNFRDVLNVMGMYPGDPGEPGLDSSGIVVNVDAGSKGGLRCGDDAFGIVWGCLKTYASTPWQLLAPRPPNYSAAAASALPTVYTTVDVAFAELAKLKKGEKVLIHAATGGVGLVAVQYAQRLGAEVYTTAGRPEKRQYLQDLGVQYIASSRNGEEFEKEMKYFLEGTDGIHVVLNSLSHDNFIGRSLNLLAPGGRFVEIGKRDAWSAEQVATLRADVHYFPLAIDGVCEHEPDRYQGLLKRLEMDLRGTWKPLASTEFEGFSKGVEALQFLQRAQHIGKVVLTVPRRLPLREDGLYVLSGGLGALGLVTAQALAEEGAKNLLLMSRSGRPSADVALQWSWLQASALQVVAWACDVSTENLQRLRSEQPIVSQRCLVRGILHLAGVLDDAMLPQLTRHHLERAYRAKVFGAKNLHSAVNLADVDFFALYSSTAALLGAGGQGNYAAANTCLDALAHHWSLQGLNAMSIQWGPWLEVGMAAQNNSFARLKINGISNELGISVLASALHGQLLNSRLGCAPVQWSGFLKQFPQGAPKYYKAFFSGARPAAESSKVESLSPDAVSGWISSVAADVVGFNVEVDEPLMAAGMDSLSSVEFRNRLSANTAGIKFPNTLMFDHPTLRAIVDLVQLQLEPTAAATVPVAVEVVAPSTAKSGVVTCKGLGCRLPGGEGLEVWSRWLQRADEISEIPYARFDVHEFFNPDMEAQGNVMYAKHGGFVEGAEMFDNAFFGVSGAEAKTIDPQHRLALEMSYAACHHAGRAKQALLGSDTGVFVGQCQHDWAKFSRERQANPFTGPGTHASISSNRISYCLGLRGASVSVDTACSSSLVALHIACKELSEGMMAALCTGVQLNLIAEPFVAFSKARMLSPDGRCKTFDASANGYVRGEGCASVLLEADTTSVLAVAATASNQDGRSSTLTAPNGPAQQEVIRKALSLAGILSPELGLVECHGTGTALGDPVETGALKATLAQGRSTPILLTTVKTNLGHLEGAAGAAGLVKTLLALQHREVPPNLHFSKLNAAIDLENFDAEIPSSCMALAGASGLSSFGFGGTNAHVICTRSGDEEGEEAAKKRTAFLFTGQGCQRVGMGKELYATEEPFRKALDLCAELLDPLLEKPLLDVLFKEDGLLDLTQYSQPAIFAVEYALAEMWKQKGVEPVAVLGHSVGEYAAAVCCGALSLKDATRLIAARGRLIAEHCERGAMTACFAPEQEVLTTMASMDQSQVAVAAVNGPKMTVVSGNKDVVDEVVKATGAGNKALNVSHGFHSPLMEPMLQAFHEEVSSVSFSTPQRRFISTVTGKEIESFTAEYWVRHVAQAVRFYDAVQSLETIEADAYLEVGPEPTLVKMGKRCLTGKKDWLHSIEQGKSEALCVAGSLATLQGCLPPLAFKRQAFPWRSAGPRLLLKRVEGKDEVCFDVPLRGDLFALAAQHLVYDEIVVPGAMVFEMAMQAARVEGHGQLRNVRLIWPLVLPKDGDRDEKQVTMRVAIIGRHFEVRSQRFGEKTWLAHCEGIMEAQVAQAVEQEFSPCADQMDTQKLYAWVETTGLWLGPKLQVCQDMRHNLDHISCRVKLQTGVPNQGFVLNPYLLDGAMHAVYAAMLEDQPCMEILAGAGKVTMFSKEVTEEALVQLKITGRTAQQLVFSCYVFTESGSRLLLHLEDVVFQKVLPQQIQKALAAAKDSVSYFETVWLPKALPPRQAEGRWLFQAELKPAEVDELGDTIFQQPGEEEELDGLQGVVYMPSQNAEPLEVLSHGLKLIQKAQEAEPVPEVWFALHGTQASEAQLLRGEELPLHAGLWGLARCLRLEVPGAVCGCLDLGALGDANPRDLEKRLRNALKTIQNSKDGLEPELLIEDRLLVPRLEEVNNKFEFAESYRFHAEGSYGITGGTGGLGLLFAAFFAENGAGHLGLISRRGKVAQDPSSQAVHQRLLRTQAQISLLPCDSADFQAVLACLQDLNGRKPLRGLLHAAGVLDDHLIMDLKPDHFVPVLKPKIDGTLNLHHALKELKLEGEKFDTFALFSSVAAMLGSPGQANYCSANAFLDAFALHRRGQGLPAVSVQWGPWAEVGMAARVGTSETGGYLRLEPLASLQAMASILSSPTALVGVARVNWSAFLAAQAKVPSFLESFQHHKKSSGVKMSSVSKDSVHATIVDVLSDVIGDHVQSKTSFSLMDMGLDSLSAVEFRNRLQAYFNGLQLKSIDLFQYHIGDLAEFIIAQVS